MAQTVEPLERPLTPDEQCEAFVGRCFIEHAFFGGPEIEDWLRDQRIAKTPDESWKVLRYCPEVVRAFKNREFTILRTCADPCDLAAVIPGLSLGLRTLLGSLDPYKATVYRAEGREIVVLFSNGRIPGSLLIEERPNAKGFQFGRLHAAIVFDNLLATWSRGGPKADAARAALITAADDEVRKVRRLAERDFNDACAVLPDGKGIMIADEVVVIEPGPADARMWIYPAHVWMKQKLTLTEAFVEAPEPLSFDLTREAFIGHVRPSGWTCAQEVAQYLLREGIEQAEVDLDDAVLFFSHRMHVPLSVLPSGFRPSP